MSLNLGLSLGLGSLGLGSSSTSLLALYAAAGKSPAYVADFVSDRFFVDSGSTNFSAALDHSRSGNATMVDETGTLVWAPHNFALNSASPATQDIIVVSGVDYTIGCTGSGSVALSGAGTGTVTDGNPVEVTASTTTLTLTVSGSVDLMWAYRSDLGGMAKVPAPRRVQSDLEYYVPTAGSAVYWPREHHHIYDGGQWVDAGVLVEPQSTNVIPYSEDLSQWSLTNVAVSGQTVTEDTSGGYHQISVTITTPGNNVCFSALIRPVSGSRNIALAPLNSSGAGTSTNVIFDMSGNFVDYGGGGHPLDIHDYGSKVLDNGDLFLWVSTDVSRDGVTASPTVRFYAGSTGSVEQYDGDGASSIEILRAQTEEGLFPTSYIPTNGSQVTRAADDLTIPANNLPYNAAGVSIAMAGRMSFADTGDNYTILVWEAAGGERIQFRLYTAATRTGALAAEQASGGLAETSAESGSGSVAPGVNSSWEIAAYFTSTAIQVAVNGTAASAGTTTPNFPDLSSAPIQVGLGLPTTAQQLVVWPEDIGDTGIEEASS